MAKRTDILLFGGSGRLGEAVVLEAKRQGMAVLAPPSAESDVRNKRSVAALAESALPSVVMNCAGYVDVDGAEREPDRCWAVNVAGAVNVAAAAAHLEIPVVYLSTDFVFDGTKQAPYDEDDVPGPISEYGKSKLEGERATAELSAMSFIVRTSALFGTGDRDFVATVMRMASERGRVDIVDDITTSPTHVADVARNLLRLIRNESIRNLPHGVFRGLQLVRIRSRIVRACGSRS